MPYDMEKLMQLVEDPPEEPQQADAAPVKQEPVVWLPISELTDCPPELHKFRPLPEAKLAELQESIRLNGILNYLKVRQLADGTYQILAGHNRRTAARNLGYDTMPCIIKELPDDDDARLAIIADNRQYREQLPSELGWSYRDELEIRKRQGQRTDLTSAQSVRKLETAESMGRENDVSRGKIRRYIRLTYLIPPLLALVDQKQLGLTVGEQLSYLSKHSQEAVHDFCYSGEATRPLKEAQARKLREIEADPDRIIDEDLLEELTAKKKSVRLRTLKLEMANLRDYFPVGTPEEVVVKTIESALAAYFEEKEDT